MKILIIRFSSLGDVILTSSVFEALNKEGIKIHFLTLKNWEELYKNDLRIDKLITVEKEKIKTLNGIKKLSQDLNRENYDYVVDLHNTLKTRILSLFLKSKTVTYKKSSLLRRLMLTFKPFKAKWLFVPELYAETFKKLGIKIKNPRPSIPLTKEEIEKALRISPKEPFIVIAPGAKWKTKRYPIEKFVEVAKLLKEKGFQTVSIGGKEEQDLGKILNQKAQTINLCGKLSIRESLSVIRISKGVISNDSAVTHMARAVKTKVLTLFGPTHPAFGFAPAEDEGKAITLNLPCSPCSLHGKTRCKKQVCFEIPPEKVVEEMMTLVPGAGIEPARACAQGILSPSRLPVPPPGQNG